VADNRLGVVDPPARFDDVTRGVVCRADLVVVPVDGSALALRVLHEVVELVGPSGGDRVRAVLARRLPRTVDRWSLVERIDEHVPGSLFVATIPMARRDSARDGAAVLYAPGTAAARAYAALAVEVADRLRVRSSQAGALSTSA
jgi:cellulose biosynthesis protein BcsQ